MIPPEGTVDDDIDQRLGQLVDNARADDLLKEAETEKTQADEPLADPLAEAADSAAGDPFAPTPAPPAPAAPTETAAEAEDVAPEATTESAPEATDAEPTAEVESDEEAPTPAEASPYDRPGDWYVVHTYAGYENKVKSNLANRIRSMHVEERIFEVVIPMEDVIEFKGGQRRVVQKKVFPGYLLVRMDLDDDSWYVVRNTPGVTGFVGPSGSKPSPLSKKEVEDILGGEKPEGAPAVEKKVRPRVEFEEGEQVRVVTGPFADFNGAIAEIDVDRSKLKVLVNIFGRETPVELEFGQVAKL